MIWVSKKIFARKRKLLRYVMLIALFHAVFYGLTTKVRACDTCSVCYWSEGNVIGNLMEQLTIGTNFPDPTRLGMFFHHELGFQAFGGGALTGYDEIFNLGFADDLMGSLLGDLNLDGFAYINSFWRGIVENSVQKMAARFSALATWQTMMVGKFFDAQQQTETMHALQIITARAINDYKPSLGVCEFNSNMLTLAAMHDYKDFAAVVLSEKELDRSLNKGFSGSAEGQTADLESRFQQFKNLFCDPDDNNGDLNDLCVHFDSTIGSSNLQYANADINFGKTLGLKKTLNVNIDDAATVAREPTNDELSLYAMTSNLYHTRINNPTPPSALETTSAAIINSSQQEYLDYRSFLAKMSVAQNSFNALSANKFQGPQGSRELAVTVLTNLGYTAAEANLMINGNNLHDVEPSYDFIMEILSKKLLENPQFYTNLYETPVNVKRTQIALQAIGLMQKFDLFKSHLRSEANLSVLLELSIEDMQSALEDEFKNQASKGSQTN